MNIVNIQQNTPEWLEFRRSRIGASDCPIIMGKSPFKTPYQLWREKMFGDHFSATEAMNRGTILEPIARKWYSNETGIHWTPTVFENQKLKWQIASIDGFNVDQDYLLEIKCPGETRISEVKNGKIPEDWTWQIQHQMAVTGHEHVVLLVFSEEDQIIIDISKNSDLIQKLEEKEYEFYEKHILGFEEPEFTDRDYIERIDTEWKFLAEERAGINLAWKQLEAQDEENRQAFIELANGHSSKGFGVTLRKHFQRGNIDYSKIPEIKNIDLNKYRKPGSDRWRLTTS